MYDAVVAAWEAKYTYNRPRPSAFDGTLTTLVTPPNSPSYPSEHAVVAGAAAAVLAYLFPDEAELYAAKAEEAARSRLLAGVQYPSDVEAGLALGRAVAARVIERAQSDRADAVWSGEMPSEPGYWTGENPFMPMAGTWQAWLLSSNDQFRPSPPPAYDSPERAAELMAVKTYTRTFASTASAFYWQVHAGIKAHWFDAAHRLIFEHRLDQNPPLAALVYAAVGVGLHDAFIACFDAKYAYWTIRPSQLDPELVTLFPNPPHPSFPAAHGCNSGAGATVLAGFFPTEREALLASGQEGGESRLWAGIHYPSDIDAGLMIGQAVGQLVVEHAEAMRR